MFKPENHPLLNDITNCPNCSSGNIALPSYPADYSDCDSCGHSWPTTMEQKQKMFPDSFKNFGHRKDITTNTSIDLPIRTVVSLDYTEDESFNVTEVVVELRNKGIKFEVHRAGVVHYLDWPWHKLSELICSRGQVIDRRKNNDNKK